MQTPWVLRNIKGFGLPASELRRVEKFKNPFDVPVNPFDLAAVSSKCNQRTLRKKERIDKVERQFLEEMQRTYQGLSADQKKVIRKTVRDDDIVRQKLRQKSSRSRPPGLSRSVILAEEQEEGENSYDATAEATQSTASVFLDHADTEFPLAPFKTVSDPMKDSASRNAIRRAPQPNSMSSVAEHSEEGDGIGDKDQPVSHVKRYAIMAEVKKIAPVRRDPQKKEKQKTALEEMEQTSLELQEWATAVLDKPVKLIEDLDPDRPDPDRPFAVSTHEAVDIGGLDVLLNACKPTLLDSKPPIRLNVVQEMNPPEALVKNLKKTLGVRINAEWKSGGRQKVQGLVLPDINHHNPRTHHERINYGRWYMKPKSWMQHMNSPQLNGSHTDAAHYEKGGLRGLVQMKLEEMRVNRDREDALVVGAAEGKTTQGRARPATKIA